MLVRGSPRSPPGRRAGVTLQTMPSPDPGARRRAQLQSAQLYLVCDSKPGGRELSEVLHAAIDGGVDIVQLRDKQLPDDELTAVAHAAQALCERLGALLIVNDRPQVAVRAGADGVHVGQDDLPVAEVREIVGPEMLIGLSTHAPLEIDAATPFDPSGSSPHVDYIGVGPVYCTPTKPGRPAVGTELASYASAHARVPFFAIGGIDSENVLDVLHAGAERICVLRAIADAEDPHSAAAALRSALDSMRPSGDGNGRG
jgi:thiamine-phosphate pyrophosphorylase